jgi:hypothetical protein
MTFSKAVNKADSEPCIPLFVPRMQFSDDEHNVRTLLMEKPLQVTSHKRRFI